MVTVHLTVALRGRDACLGGGGLSVSSFLVRRLSVPSLALLIAVFAIGGCATIDMRTGIEDAALARKAVVAGFPGVRFWADEVPGDLNTEMERRLPNMPDLMHLTANKRGRPLVEILALSGGGGDGAFGAGYLAGWTARGDRPVFEVVTGISAGAIIAPFAFLGSRYDDKLEEIWTSYKTSEIATAHILPGLLGGPALADTAPLKALIARYVDKRMLREIAHEYQTHGRILLVGTTNLDAQRPVVWNMGEIAASGHPGALDLFRDVIMASAAIPGAFPPVNIQVTAGDQTFTEMHVDGGTTQEFFVSPMNVPFQAFDALYPKPPIRKIFLINNSKVNPEQEVVKEQTIPIATRAISTLIKSQRLDEIYRIYRMAKDARADFNFIAVPPDFNAKSNQLFDPEYQRALFDEGFRAGKAGNRWLKQPPDILAQK